MNDTDTSSSDSDASPATDSTTEQSAENEREHAAADSATTTAMARALKHTLEQKGMTVEVEDDGETLSAEKLGQSYRIHPNGIIDGNGVLRDGLEDIIADLNADHDGDHDPESEEAESAEDTEPNPDSTSPDRGSSGTPGESSDEDGSSDEDDNADDSDSDDPAPVPTAPASSAESSAEADGMAEADASAEADETDEIDETADTAATDDASSTVNDDEPEDEGESLPTGTVQQFEASIEAGRLQKALDAANAVVDECRIHLDTDEFVIRAVDPANVAMIDEHVSADAFEAYETSCGVLGVNLERLIEVVGMADNDDLVQFENDAETRKLGIQVDSVEYTLALIDPDSIRQEPDIPDLDLPASISIDQAEVKRAFRAADMVSDHINLCVDEHEECFIATAEGDTDDVELAIGREDLVEASFGSANSLFSLDYLKDIRKPIPKDTTVHIQLGEEFPVRLAFEMVDGDVGVEFMVAPRITGH